jgi:hypothetical protein
MRFIKLTVALVLFVAGIAIGFRLGVNSRARTELSVSIPALVQIHKSIQSGDPHEAMDLTEMLLLSKLDRYNSLKDSFVARLVYGKDIVGSQLFQKHLNEAVVIRQTASTNLIFFNNSMTNR